jgi:hypothetical protein
VKFTSSQILQIIEEELTAQEKRTLKSLEKMSRLSPAGQKALETLKKKEIEGKTETGEMSDEQGERAMADLEPELELVDDLAASETPSAGSPPVIKQIRGEYSQDKNPDLFLDPVVQPLLNQLLLTNDALSFIKIYREIVKKTGAKDKMKDAVDMWHAARGDPTGQKMASEWISGFGDQGDLRKAIRGKWIEHMLANDARAAGINPPRSAAASDNPFIRRGTKAQRAAAAQEREKEFESNLPIPSSKLPPITQEKLVTHLRGYFQKLTKAGIDPDKLYTAFGDFMKIITDGGLTDDDTDKLLSAAGFFDIEATGVPKINPDAEEFTPFTAPEITPEQEKRIRNINLDLQPEDTEVPEINPEMMKVKKKLEDAGLDISDLSSLQRTMARDRAKRNKLREEIGAALTGILSALRAGNIDDDAEDEEEIEERKLTKKEKTNREKLAKHYKPAMKSFKKQYGDKEGKSIYYATMTKKAKEGESPKKKRKNK